MGPSSAPPAPKILTVGHSTHTLEHLLRLLTTNAVRAIGDVRSSPYSRLHPQFNRERLAEFLERKGIEYIFLGGELGARPRDPDCYEDGRVKYGRVASKHSFRTALDQVIQMADTRKLALLCAERDPLLCHRSILISRELERCGVNVGHIHSDASIEHHADAVERLLRTLDMLNLDMFKPRQEIIDNAYAAQEERIAYVDERMHARPGAVVE